MGQRRDDLFRLAPFEFLLQQAEYSSRHSQHVAGQQREQVGRNEGCEVHRLAFVGRLSRNAPAVGGGFETQNAEERSELGSQTAIRLTNRRELRGFPSTRKPRRFAGTAWWTTVVRKYRPFPDSVANGSNDSLRPFDTDSWFAYEVSAIVTRPLGQEQRA